jgi:hypothetical protein
MLDVIITADMGHPRRLAAVSCHRTACLMRNTGLEGHKHHPPQPGSTAQMYQLKLAVSAAVFVHISTHWAHAGAGGSNQPPSSGRCRGGSNWYTHSYQPH